MGDDGMDGLEALRAAVAACRVCRDAPARGAEYRLPHEPRPVAVISSTARILIAGQAPGLRVHQSGLPFDDASGNRLRQWLCAKHKVKSRGTSRFPDQYLYDELGLIRLSARTKSFPWANA